ncbi:hypothetical protein GOP47_0002548 [Adiantum capillus-veneris]|uniref:peptidylprolyl isomerase n=1 Tax=Adiantum capillus-veneris TaxID=13818 RepID=A0A9D4VB51_ADICA|nr:hypothetical protein GOP47_0002548 [Adiantum capillus-veneris]
MLSVSSQRLSLVSVPHSNQKWLCNRASSTICRDNLAVPSKENPFSVDGLTSLHLKVVYSRSLCALAWRILHACDARALKSAQKEGLQSSSAVLPEEDNGMLRRVFLTNTLYALPALPLPALAVTEKKNMGKKSSLNDMRILEQNKRMQALNSAPTDFPGFIREGYNVKLVTTEQYKKCESGLIYLDIEEGHGDYPRNGQQVTFHYIGYNESGRRVDSSYQQGQPAKTRLGIKAMIPGFEEGLRTMKPGGKRRLIIPPDLGPPVGPSTFFSAKQFEVFDVEFLGAKDCTRRTIGFYSDYVCD